MQASAQSPTPRAVSSAPILDLAEWTNGYIGLETVTLARGDVHSGKYLYAEIFTPRSLRHPYPIILVHGGNSQGLDWLTTPDGRRGWALLLVEQGYRVYVIDRPGQGRPPYSPDLHGPYADVFGRPPAPTYEQAIRNVVMSDVAGHTQWPGSGQIGDRALDQFMGSQGPALPNAIGAETAWRFSGAKLLDETGPAIFLTHGDGATFAWVAADERPNLVKAIVTVESNNDPFAGQVVWGLTAIPLQFDPPLTDPHDFRLTEWTPPPGSPGPNRPFRIQAEPARRLTNLRGIPIMWMQGENPYAGPAQVQFLTQSGCDAELVRLRDRGIEEGNTNLMLLERNNFEVFAIIRDWLNQRVRPV